MRGNAVMINAAAGNKPLHALPTLDVTNFWCFEIAPHKMGLIAALRASVFELCHKAVVRLRKIHKLGTFQAEGLG